jgi:hypothetical protein
VGAESSRKLASVCMGEAASGPEGERLSGKLGVVLRQRAPPTLGARGAMAANAAERGRETERERQRQRETERERERERQRERERERQRCENRM